MARISSLVSVMMILCWLSCGNVPPYTVRCESEELFQPAECLMVPASEFVSSLKTTIDTVRQVTSVVSKFTSLFGDFRLTNAVSDCLDLLDLSSDELGWTLSASQNPNGKYNSTGNLSSDMRTWLSGALINQETCLDGFDGTGESIVENVVSGSLSQVTSLVSNILGQVRPVPNKVSRGTGGFPSWIKQKERKLLQQTGTGTGGGPGIIVNAVVAADGSGNYSTITEAVEAAPELSTERYVIYIKKGVYREYVEIKKKKWNIMMIGDGIDVTVVSGNRNFIDGWTTYRSATFAVKGRGFIARDMTFENTAGPEKHQAVAYRSDSDLSVVYRCAIRGYQDSLYAHSMRQFYRESIITGTVDFIFGDSTSVFQSCQIIARKGLPNQKNTITAHGRKDIGEPTGFSIQFSNITSESLPSPINSNFSSAPETYLGRPWKLYSRTVFMQCYLSNLIKPRGWLEWNGGDFALDTLYYGEYLNYGAGAALGGRVNWTGFHAINDSAVANNFTVSQFILGNSWLPSTGVKYTAGLSGI